MVTKDCKKWDANEKLQICRYKTGGGIMDVVPNYKNDFATVIRFFVPEKERGRGIGGKLIDSIKKDSKKIHAQASRLNSASLFYKKGFRPDNFPNASLSETKELFNKSSSGSMGMVIGGEF